MITVTRLDQSTLVINAEMIVSLEAAPDTIMTLVGGDKLTVCEPVHEIIERVVAYKRRIGHLPAVLKEV